MIKTKIVKMCGYIGLILFASSLIIGYIVAQFDADGFNIFDNDISDLGSIRNTPIPLLLDFGVMSMSILLIPTVILISKTLKPTSQYSEFSRRKAIRLRISQLFYDIMGSLGILIGLIGLFGLGLFSKDRTTELNLHADFALICFLGIVFGGFFLGILIVYFQTIFPKILGLYMIIIPPIPFLLLMFGQPPLSPIYEWIMVTSFCGWLLPVIIII